MYHLYILKLKDNSYYIGSTGNLEQRLKYHRTEKVRSTRKKLPFTLMYSEMFSDRSGAQAREYQVKKWKSRAAIERLFKKG